MPFGSSLFSSVQTFCFQFEVISYQAVLQLCFVSWPKWYPVQRLFNCFQSKFFNLFLSRPNS